jgi:two-component system, LytTR family, response regulator
MIWSITVFLWEVIYFGEHYFESFRTSEVEKLRLAVVAKDSQLRALISQVNPHFIFNCLNGLRAMIVEDPARAQDMVTELSNILRYSLQSGRTDTVPLETELEAVTAYLKLEAIRLEERLRVHIALDPESLETRIPPMLLQTLVENGIKHGVARLPGGGEIRVDSQVESRAVKIQVRNSGQLRDDAGSTRLGLDNARERLRLLYGNAASLVLRNYDGGFRGGRNLHSAEPRMKALIVDDERLGRAELRRLLEPHPEVEIVGEARDADEALALIEQLQPDLLFLDIQMPGRSGFELLEQLDRVPLVVFTTAYDEYALKAFEVNALDYLLKPVSPERLDAALARAALRKAKPAMDAGQRIFVKDGERCWFVTLADVVLLESEGNYARLFFGGNRPLVLRSLNYLEERLDPAIFFRASRKHILNLRFIENIDPWANGGFLVKLKGGFDVEMSRRQAQKFKEVMSL